MAISDTFRQTLFINQNSVAAEHYERESSSIFEKEYEKSKIEVRCISALDLRRYQKCGLGTPNFPKVPLTVVEFSGGQVRLPTEVLPFQESCDSEDTTHGAVETVGTESLIYANHHCITLPSTRLETIDLDPEQLQILVQHTNQSFRVFYIRQHNSFSRLQVTQAVFNRLLNACDVFPQFREFLSDFKFKTRETEVAPPRIRFRPHFDGNRSSGRGFETAYILRFMEHTNRTKSRPWSLRQFAVYHRSNPDLSRFCSTWLLVGSSQRTEQYVDRQAESTSSPSHSNPFELHVMFLDIVISSWRPYLLHLSEQVEITSTKAVLTAVGDRSAMRDIYEIDEKDFQKLKGVEDRACDALLCLDSSLDTATVFADMYHRYCSRQAENDDASNCLSLESPQVGDAISFALSEKQKDAAYARKKVEALLAKVRNTRSLISTLMERQNGVNLNQQISALQSLQRQGQEENAIMRQLAEKGSRDSASVRILTIITLIYLPCTVVSSFYSTQFVNRKDLDSGGSSMEYAKNSWLFFAVSIPLTFLTIAIWWVWANYAPWITRWQRKEKTKEQDPEIA